jgi:hypothetical protein
LCASLVAAWQRGVEKHIHPQMHADKMRDNVPTLAEIRIGGTELSAFICVHLRMNMLACFC